MSLLNILLPQPLGREPIHLLSRRDRFFPKRFRWRGHVYNVEAVTRAWTETQRGGRVKRHGFRVRCPEGSFILYEDVQRQAWYLTQKAD